MKKIKIEFEYIEPQIHISSLVAKCEAIGRWMSAALDDPSVCEEMKIDIGAYFDGVSGLTKIFPKIEPAKIEFEANDKDTHNKFSENCDTFTAPADGYYVFGSGKPAEYEKGDLVIDPDKIESKND